MVNFGPLTAEIGSGFWGTPANFNGFHILAALLHSTLVVGVSESLQHWTEGATLFGRAAITLGIGPHSSLLMLCCFIMCSVTTWSGTTRYRYSTDCENVDRSNYSRSVNLSSLVQ